MPKILHVTKIPPSGSGVARYADRFRVALTSLATVDVLVTGHEAAETARLRRVVSVVSSLRRHLLGKPDWVVVEVSGRAIAELVATAWLLSRRRRPRVWITVHDPPYVTGGLFWFGALDRSGLRRVAAFLSRHVGDRVERWTLEHADVVVCLSEAGASSLQHQMRLTRGVRRVSPVADASRGASRRSQVFVAGPVSVAPALRLIESVPPEPGITVVVGWCDPATQQAVRARAGALGVIDRLSFTGLLTQAELTAQLRRSLVVVHSRGSGPSSLERGTPLACSYPVIDGMSSGCAIVTDAARGAHEYMVASGAGIDLDDHPERLVTAVTDLMRNPDTARALGERAYRFAAEHFAPGRVACEVNALMASSDRRR